MGPEAVIRLDQALRGVARIGIDTAPFIYLIDQDPARVRTVRRVVERITEGRLQGYTSVLTLTECLYRPMQTGDYEIEREYRELLLSSKGLTFTPILESTAVLAARLRAKYNISTPDSIHVAAAIESGCQAFLTNDNRLRPILDLRVLMLDDLRV